MLKEELEKAVSKGTRSNEGIKPSSNRYRFNEIIHSVHKSGALTLRPRIGIRIERLSPECRDKIKTFLQTRSADPTEISPFSDTPFGIRRIHAQERPLHIEATGDKLDKVPWVLTATILEGVMGWRYQGSERITNLSTKKGPKRVKDMGLFREEHGYAAVMFRLSSNGDWRRILVKWLNDNRQVLIEYKPAGRSNGESRLGYRFFIDYVMFSSSWLKRKAIEILTPFEKEFNGKYEPTLAQTKKTLMHSATKNCHRSLQGTYTLTQDCFHHSELNH